MESLAAAVRRHEVETMLHNARLTRDWPIAEDRYAEASRQARMAMYRSALGQISQDERDRVLDILRPCCLDLLTSSLPAQHE